MEKIIIDIEKKGDSQGSNFLPVLKYLAKKGIHPREGSLKNMDIFSEGHDGIICVMIGEPDYKEIEEVFEFHK